MYAVFDSNYKGIIPYMSSIIRNITGFAQLIVKEHVKSGDVLVDATCGNGHDTLFLAGLRPSGLYAFDIQPQAIRKTETLLRSSGYDRMLDDGTVRLICDSHEKMEKYITSPVSAVMFNLGYLPSGDRKTMTAPSSTMEAVVSGLSMLRKDGIMCITMYPGHGCGRMERDMLISYSETLDTHEYHSAAFRFTNQPKSPPELLMITRK